VVVNSKCSFAAGYSIVDAQDLNNILNGIADERACYIPQSKCTEHREKYIQNAMSSMFLISFINDKRRSKFQIVILTRKSIIGPSKSNSPTTPNIQDLCRCAVDRNKTTL
jgi:hypothetical protein